MPNLERERKRENDLRLEKKRASESTVLLVEGKRVLQKLRFIVQNKGSGTDIAVAVTLELARRATLDFAFAAHSRETEKAAQNAARKHDYIPIFKGRVPQVAECLNKVEVFNTYRPRPRRKGVSERERIAIEMLNSDISEFWHDVVLPRSNIPPISNAVRSSLLAHKNRRNSTAWAKALLKWREDRELGFLLESGGPLRAICARMNRPNKRASTDSIRAGFVKLAREHFVPLLKHEANRTNFAFR